MLRPPNIDFGDLPFDSVICNKQWMFDDTPECLATFLEMFNDIPQNVWRDSPKYNISLIPHVPRISFTVPVFLVLYIAGWSRWRNQQQFLIKKPTNPNQQLKINGY